MKAFLRRCVDLVVALVLVGAMLAYLMINTVVATHLINDLRLDTYETGFGVVLLVLLLGWGPVWLMRSLDNNG
jgi:NADH:ubiquinone oxidoreductase subunit 3 (subunit A)